ncbi:MAG: phage holin family protein [Verrucomicrobia bacterium]|nr:phage holin family protein [Verrucomicrobiota bacterium]
MSEDEQIIPSAGVWNSAKRLLESLSGLLAIKCELLGIELEDAKRRGIELLALGLATLLFGGLAVTVLTFGVIALNMNLPETIETAPFFWVGAIYTLATVALIALFRWRAGLAAKVFDASIRELKEDVEWIKRRI